MPSVWHDHRRAHKSLILLRIRIRYEARIQVVGNRNELGGVLSLALE